MEETDGFPSQICAGCEQELKTSYTFRTKCDESYKAFQELLKQVQTIQTEQELNEEDMEVHVEVKIDESENIPLTPRMKYKRKLADVKQEEVTDLELMEDEEVGDDQEEMYELEQLESEPEEQEIVEKSTSTTKKMRKMRANVDPELSEAINNALESIKTEAGLSYEEINDTENNQKCYQCNICEKRFTRQTHVKRHMLTHSSIKPYKCKSCDKSFSRSDHLQKHSILHSQTRSYVCELCPNKEFSRPETLKNHMKRHTSEPKAKTFVCDTCRKAFTSQKYLDTHVQTHTTPKLFNCKFCPEIFDERKDLHQHNKLHINERPYLCSECGQRFLRNDYLVIHMRRHKGEKPYKCRFCEKCFPRATDLTVHERYHTDAKTHLCTTCGKGFHRAYNLLVHMRVHTGNFFIDFLLFLLSI